jgi:hypothetical protein
MIKYRYKHTIGIKTIAAVVVCLFLANQLACLSAEATALNRLAILAKEEAYPDALATSAGDTETQREMLDEMRNRRDGKSDRGKGNYIEGLEALVEANVTSKERARTLQELMDMREFGETTVRTELRGYIRLGLVKVISAKESPDDHQRYYLAEGVTREAVAILREEVDQLKSARLEDDDLRALVPRVREIVPNNAEMRYIIGMCLLMRGEMKTPETKASAMETVASVLVDKRDLWRVAQTVGHLYSDEYIGNWIAEYLEYRKNNATTLERRREGFHEFLVDYARGRKGGEEFIARLFAGPNAIVNVVEAKAESGVLARLARPFFETEPDVVTDIYAGFRKESLSGTILCNTDESGRPRPLAEDQRGPVVVLECSTSTIRAACRDVTEPVHQNLQEAIRQHNWQKGIEVRMKLSDKGIRYLLAVGILSQRKHKRGDEIGQSLVELLDTTIPLKYALQELGHTLTEELIAACAILYLQYFESKSDEERGVLEGINYDLRQAVKRSELKEDYSAYVLVFLTSHEFERLAGLTHVPLKPEQIEYQAMIEGARRTRDRRPGLAVAALLSPDADQAQPAGPGRSDERQTGYAALEDDPIPIGPARRVHEPHIDTAIRKAVEGEDLDVVKTVRLGKEAGYKREISHTMSFFDANRELSQLRKVVEDLMDEDEKYYTLGEHPEGYPHRILIIDKEGEPICRVPVHELEEIGARARERLGRKSLQIKGHASDRGPTVMDTKDPTETARIIIFETLRFMGVDKDTTNEVNAHLKKFGLTTQLPPSLTKAVSEQVAARMTPERPGNLLTSMGTARQAAMAKKPEPLPKPSSPAEEAYSGYVDSSLPFLADFIPNPEITKCLRIPLKTLQGNVGAQAYAQACQKQGVFVELYSSDREEQDKIDEQTYTDYGLACRLLPRNDQAVTNTVTLVLDEECATIQFEEDFRRATGGLDQNETIIVPVSLEEPATLVRGSIFGFRLLHIIKERLKLHDQFVRDTIDHYRALVNAIDPGLDFDITPEELLGRVNDIRTGSIPGITGYINLLLRHMPKPEGLSSEIEQRIYEHAAIAIAA